MIATNPCSVYVFIAVNLKFCLGKLISALVGIWDKDIDIFLAFLCPSLEWWSHVWVGECIFVSTILQISHFFSPPLFLWVLVWSYWPPTHLEATQDSVVCWLLDQIRRMQKKMSLSCLATKSNSALNVGPHFSVFITGHASGAIWAFLSCFSGLMLIKWAGRPGVLCVWSLHSAST